MTEHGDTTQHRFDHLSHSSVCLTGEWILVLGRYTMARYIFFLRYFYSDSAELFIYLFIYLFICFGLKHNTLSVALHGNTKMFTKLKNSTKDMHNLDQPKVYNTSVCMKFG